MCILVAKRVADANSLLSTLSLIMSYILNTVNRLACRQHRAALPPSDLLSSCAALYRAHADICTVSATLFKNISVSLDLCMLLPVSSWIGSITTPFHRAVPSCRVARNKTLRRCSRTRRFRLCKCRHFTTHAHTYTQIHTICTHTCIRAQRTHAQGFTRESSSTRWSKCIG